MIYRLSDSLTGKRYKIVAVNLTEKQTAKLDKLGIFPGETVTITLIIDASGAAIAVGKEIAEKIEVVDEVTEYER